MIAASLPSVRVRPRIRALYLLCIVSALIHAALLALPLKAPVVQPAIAKRDTLFAVELLQPQQLPENNAAAPALPAARPPEQRTVESQPRTPAAAPQPAGQREATVSLDRLSDADAQYRSYLGHLRSKINTVWQYPPEARDTGLYGVVTVRFSIARSGRLESLTIKHPSGYRLLDTETLRTIRAAAPFRPFPSEFTIDTLHVSASFEYEFSQR